MNEFLHMGGYAFYVWSSYAATFIVLLLVFIWPIKQRRRLLCKLKLSQSRQEKLARRQ